MSQIALPLDWAADAAADAFVVAPSNARAVHLLDHWGAWPVMTAILTGPPRAGRRRRGGSTPGTRHRRLTAHW